MKNLFGIMQGRLLPKYLGKYQAHPVGYWKEEFHIASEFGFDCIEFILDYNKADQNPLLLEEGLQSILNYSKRNNILVKSVCADFFMESPIYSDDLEIINYNYKILKKLIINSKKIGIRDIVIPLVDRSSIMANEQKQFLAVNFLKKICNEIKNNDVNICLETDLPPQEFLNFVNRINRSQIKINYDTGNSVSLGYDFREEFALYGHLVTNIHLKDRKLNQGSVKLGSGDCHFKDFFIYLSNIKFDGIFILQAFREDNAIPSLQPQYEFIMSYLKKYFYNHS